MCIATKDKSSGSPVKDAASEIQPVEVPAPRSPWAKMLFRQISKPKLPRKIVPSAKINLNKYWSKFGELMTSPSSKGSVLCDRLSKMTLRESDNHTEARKRLAFTPEAVPQTVGCEDQKAVTHQVIGAITDVKGQRFEVLEDGLSEIDENMANEIKEIEYLTIEQTIRSVACKCLLE